MWEKQLTGHVLWIQEGKKKQVVYDFFDFVGEEWMSGVEAVACDMNSDFQEAFEDRCPDIQIVYDHFHNDRPCFYNYHQSLH